jgi:hypothetical protein
LKLAQAALPGLVKMEDQTVPSFDKLTQKIETLFHKGFVHDQLLSVRYTHVQPDYKIKIGGA